MTCRNRGIYLPQQYFDLFSCSRCYSYLFPKDRNLQSVGLSLKARNGSLFEPETVIFPDVNNSTVVQKVCRFINSDNCKRWTDCCQSAIRCCKRQLSQLPYNSNNTADYCPRTWDGYDCFDDTPSGSNVVITCPSYVENVKEGAKALKTCTENGTWYTDPSSNLEWTDYTNCIYEQENPIITNQTLVIFIGLACNIISIILLLLACGIFLSFRQLRIQHRIRLHLNLFISFVIYAITTILWDFLLMYDRLQNSTEQSRMYQNGIGCKFLYIFLRYTRSSNFFWMACEGFYLHTLIVHAFKVPKTLIGYYAFGWGICWIPVGIYAIVRATDPIFDLQCWVLPIGGFEWLIYTPNLLCIAVNIFFFINILRILLTQLQTHPNEPSNYRRAFKATFVLVPLFGVQFLTLVYRPKHYIYDIFQSIVKNSQGTIVALVFCIFNGEVHTYMKSYIRNKFPGKFPEMSRNYSTTSNTQYTNVSMQRRGTRTAEQNPNYIALSTVDDVTTPTENTTKQSNGDTVGEKW